MTGSADAHSEVNSPFLDLFPDASLHTPAGQTSAAYRANLNAMVSGQRNLHQTHARQTAEYEQYRSRIVGAIRRVWEEIPEFSPDNIRAQQDVAIMYGNYLRTPPTDVRFSELTGLDPADAAARLAAMSVLGQSTALMGLLRGRLPGLNTQLDANLRLGGNYVLNNLRLLGTPAGIMGFSDQYLSKWGISRSDIHKLGLDAQLPTLHTPPGPLVVLTADVVHANHQAVQLGKQQTRVVRAMANAAHRFYNYDAPEPITSVPPILRVLAECLVVESSDFSNAPEPVKKALATRLYVAAMQTGITSPAQLPNKRAQDVFSGCMKYHQAHRFDAVVATVTRAQEAWADPQGAMRNIGRHFGFVE